MEGGILVQESLCLDVCKKRAGMTVYKGNRVHYNNIVTQVSGTHKADLRLSTIIFFFRGKNKPISNLYANLLVAAQTRA